MESDRHVKEVLAAVRALVKEEKNLHCPLTDDYLMRFITASKYDVQKSYILVKDYFRAKMENPEAFVVGKPADYMSTISRLDLGYVLHKPDSCGRRVGYIKLGDVDPGKEVWDDIVQTLTISLEALSLEKDVQEHGLAVVLDCTNFTLKIMKWATPYKIRIILKFLQDCVPVRIEVMHVVNYPIAFNVFFATMKPFIKAEIMNKVRWHRKPFTELMSCLGPELLPNTLGGTLNLTQVSDWHRVVSTKEPTLLDFRNMGYQNLKIEKQR